ncbi:MAG: LysR family transcriptional regulator [Parasporobacterium sp.]|nr:LysR family transcriptional regulator [Parasporobacterium sp.]
MTTNLSYFMEIVKYGSFSTAATNLGISQPALSGYIRKLEKSLGIVLFDRSVNPVQLTAQGQAYLEYATKQAKLEEAFYNQIHDIEGEAYGTITIGGAVTSNICYLPAVVAAFKADFPHIDLKVIDGKVPDIARMAANDEVDFFFTPTKVNQDAFEYEPLLFEDLLFCVPPMWKLNERWQSHRLDPKNFDKEPYGGPLRPATTYIHDLPFILLEEGVEVRKISEDIFTELGTRPKSFMTVGQVITAINMTVQGAGVTFAPETVLRMGNFETLPEMYPLELRSARRSMYVCYKKTHYMSRAAAEFINLLKKTFS